MKFKFIILILIVLGVFYSCSKSPKCWGDNKNKGVIVSSVQIACEPLSELQNFIINDDSTFQEIFTNSLTGELFCSLPSIDFNSYSLLGLFASGGCEVKFIREVVKIEEEKEYHYDVIVKSCGGCKKESYSFNWVTVPKVPDGWDVLFQVSQR